MQRNSINNSKIPITIQKHPLLNKLANKSNMNFKMVSIILPAKHNKQIKIIPNIIRNTTIL